MFCINCGTQLPEEAKFCMQCGSAVKPEVSVAEGGQTQLVAARCTNCNGELEVDPTMQTALCPYCNSAYIVEQAIQNYQVTMHGNMNIHNATIHVNGGVNTDNLLARAEQFYEEGDYESALEYYNRVLDNDITNRIAKEGVESIKREMEDYSYYRVAGNKGFTSGTIMLKKDKLIFRDNKGRETVYELMHMKNIHKSMGVLAFNYSGKFSEQALGVQGDVAVLIDHITNAQLGIYPQMHIVKKSNLEQYIIENFTDKILAIKYYREQTGAGLAESKDAIDKIM